MALPKKYSFLLKETGPKMLTEALKHYGTLEHKGKGSNPNILQWAKEVGVSGWYKDDDVPWCSLFVAVVAKRAGYTPPDPKVMLGAISWAKWGEGIPHGRESLWDILVFSRPGGNHVGFYAGESEDSYLVYGGNQSNSVTFSWLPKARLIAARRPFYKIGEPDNVRKVIMSRDGVLSTDER